jgi:hypothetical protein
MANREKVPRHAVEPAVKKMPRHHYPAEGESAELISWRIGDVELEGPWGWGTIPPEKARLIHVFLSALEKLTWGIACHGGKPVRQVKVKDAPAEARKRLEETGRDDVESLTELHLGGLSRIWGVRRGSACHLLWWDPEHKVWPSRK